MDTTWFPFDDQTCEIKIGSWVYNGFKLNLKLQSEEADTGSYVMNPDWMLVGAPAKLNEVLYECCPEPYLDIQYSIHLRRRVSKYWSTVIIPQYLMALICLCAGFIPLTAPTPRFCKNLILNNLLDSLDSDLLPSS